MHHLVIAEKPSVAGAIAEVLGAQSRKNGYWEGDGIMVTWCVGHLVELAMPDAYDPRYAKWRREDLPIIPQTWRYQVNAKTKAQFGTVKRLMNDAGVQTVICATDAGREGELIFRLIYMMAGCRKPVKRLWISSLEKEAIRQGFAALRDGREYDRLYDAALCRAQADWLVGLNATRLYSILHGVTLNVGRVMTPTLAMVTQRDSDIGAFRSETYYLVQIDCGNGLIATSERYADRQEAERIRRACHCQAAIVIAVEDTPKTDNPPKLYDLTALQRDANRIYGFTAQQTLDYAQSLYEKKLMTYPRTDSRYLNESMRAGVSALVIHVSGLLSGERTVDSAVNIEQMLCDTKVTDHHAILPTQSVTQEQMEGLAAGECSLLNLVMMRLICAAGEKHRYLQRTVHLDCQGVRFTAKGKVVLQAGWTLTEAACRKAIGLGRAEEGQMPLPDMAMGQRIERVMAAVKDGKTTPPKHYTEDTLLSAMEKAGSEQAPEDAERKGLGTPATRAGIIEKLIQSGYIERKGEKKARYLMATGKGHSLIHVVAEQIRSPIMTAEWEQRLQRIERGEDSAAEFMDGIARFLDDLIRNAEPEMSGPSPFMIGQNIVGKCPRCGAAVRENGKGFFCENRACTFGIYKNNGFFRGKPLNAAVVGAMMKEGFVRLTGLRSAKTGKTYDATVIMDDDGSGYPRFRLSFDDGRKSNK